MGLIPELSLFILAASTQTMLETLPTFIVAPQKMVPTVVQPPCPHQNRKYKRKNDYHLPTITMSMTVDIPKCL